ncbi:hypothetical protein ACFQY4_10715 [Catellatospora bangladeshensis]|uniref:Uncharacterized protein n=1 Tax=Catellatospora bangladeshensis TaxID=310355 RepID=A0A8J3JMK5_9ACTN|nr:hypothetical protein [Catellatospora bangladeshensis]GIF81735.1 hypothetical protein Cba03nite_30840 [Catellatospora bangladeshensis]
MLIRREEPTDVAAVRALTEAAFAPRYAPAPQVEAGLLDELRVDEGWLPALSLVAVVGGEVVGTWYAPAGASATGPCWAWGR